MGFVRIYFIKLGAHYHMRVFTDVGKMGDLCAAERDWQRVRDAFTNATFIEEGKDGRVVDSQRT
jgi:hypothetical protein